MPVWLGIILVIAGIVLIFSGAALIVRKELGKASSLAGKSFWDFLIEVIAKGGAGGVLVAAGIICLLVGGAGLGVTLDWFGDGTSAQPTPSPS